MLSLASSTNVTVIANAWICASPFVPGDAYIGGTDAGTDEATDMDDRRLTGGILPRGTEQL